MVALYILGILQRHGPQHGYSIKRIIAEQCSDFTQIKLPTIYYHLEKLRADGLLSAHSDQQGNRPEKTVYAITGEGERAFRERLNGLLAFEYRPLFPSDGAFFFSDSLDMPNMAQSLQTYRKTLEHIIVHIQGHQEQSLRHVPREARASTEIIFRHHLAHYRAELGWVDDALKLLRQEEEPK